MRSLRRHHFNRIKEKFRKIARKAWSLGEHFVRSGELPRSPIPPKQEDPRAVGIAVSTHCANCSCPMCGNPRKHFNRITRQEKIAELNYKEQVDEIDDE